MSSTPDTSGQLHHDTDHRDRDDKGFLLTHATEALEQRSFVLFFWIPALLALLNVPAPLVILGGGCVVYTACLCLAGYRHLPLLNSLSRFRMQSRLANWVLRHVLDALSRIDERPHHRLRWLTEGPFASVGYLLLICAGAALIAAGLLGLPTGLLGLCMAVLSLSLLTRDGLFVLLGGLVLSFASIGPAVSLL